jgi:hypothetical protein
MNHEETDRNQTNGIDIEVIINDNGMVGYLLLNKNTDEEIKPTKSEMPDAFYISLPDSP